VINHYKFKFRNFWEHKKPGILDNKFGVTGKYKIKIINKDTGLIENEEINNRIMDDVLDELIKVLQGTATDLEIKYLALGTDNTAITDTDAALGAEIFRVALTDITKTGTGELTSLAIVLDSEAVDTIEEIGIFAGAAATAAADSGTLVSRILWTRIKSSSEELQFTRIDTIVRG